MKVIYWNVKGLNASDKRVQIKQQLDACGVDVVILQETKTFAESFQVISKKLNKWQASHLPPLGASGGLITLWNAKTICMSNFSFDHNWKLMKVTHFDLFFWLLNVYGPTSTAGKNLLWEALKLKIDGVGKEKIILVGDFNAITNLLEKKGGICPPKKDMEYFATFIQDNALVDVIPQNGGFT